jgi:hypothetical protein
VVYVLTPWLVLPQFLDPDKLLIFCRFTEETAKSGALVDERKTTAGGRNSMGTRQAEKQTALDWVEANRARLSDFHLAIWSYAEPAWREYKSA